MKNVLRDIFSLDKYKNNVRIDKMELITVCNDQNVPKAEWQIRLLINTAFSQDDSSLISYVHRKVRKYFEEVEEERENEWLEIMKNMTESSTTSGTAILLTKPSLIRFNQSDFSQNYGITDRNTTSVIKQIKKIKPLEAVLIVVLFIALVFIFGALFYEICSCFKSKESKKFKISTVSSDGVGINFDEGGISPRNIYVKPGNNFTQTGIQPENIQTGDYRSAENLNISSVGRIQTGDYQGINQIQTDDYRGIKNTQPTKTDSKVTVATNEELPNSPVHI